MNILLAQHRDRLSTEQICGELQQASAKIRLHHETIYRYRYHHPIVATKQVGNHEELTQYLRIRHCKHYKKPGKLGKRQLIPNQMSIEEWPPIAETNTYVGNWKGAAYAG